jgi:3',5'-cyclic-AMP phosphodiesterase
MIFLHKELFSMKRRTFLTKTFATISLLGPGSKLLAFPPSRAFPGEEIKLRFAIASDGHYGQPETAFDQFHDEMMSWLNKEHTNHELAFTLFNGDLIHDDPLLLNQVKAKYDQLEMPYYVSRGNHDRCNSDLWQSTWSTPLNHSFTVDNSAFIILDTSDEQGQYLCPDYDWTAEEFHKHASAASLFVFMHITPRKWTQNGVSCTKLTTLFAKQKNLKAIFHGHDHDQDSVMTHKGKPYFFDGHLGGSWGVSYRGYRIVEILKNETVLTYQVNPQQGTKVNSGSLER